jgi:hypothetical protein
VYTPQTPFFNAGAYGATSRSSSSTGGIETLDDDELRVLTSPDLGHVMSGHALYRTIAAGPR